MALANSLYAIHAAAVHFVRNSIWVAERLRHLPVRALSPSVAGRDLFVTRFHFLRGLVAPDNRRTEEARLIADAFRQKFGDGARTKARQQLRTASPATYHTWFLVVQLLEDDLPE